MAALIKICGSCRHDRVLEQAAKALYEWTYDRQQPTAAAAAAGGASSADTGGGAAGSGPAAAAAGGAGRVCERVISGGGAAAMVAVCGRGPKTRSGALQGAAGVLKNIAKWPGLRAKLSLDRNPPTSREEGGGGGAAVAGGGRAIVHALIRLCVTASNHGVLAQACLALKFFTAQHHLPPQPQSPAASSSAGAGAGDDGGGGEGGPATAAALSAAETRQLRLQVLHADGAGPGGQAGGIVALLRVVEHTVATLGLSKRRVGR